MSDAIMVKTPDEIHCLRMAGVITESAHWAVCKALRPGMTEFDCRGCGKCPLCWGRRVEGPSFVVCRERSGYGAEHAHRQNLKAGDLVILDINGVSYQATALVFALTAWETSLRNSRKRYTRPLMMDSWP
jgi:Xaa-Pro aminopeptidase